MAAPATAAQREHRRKQVAINLVAGYNLRQIAEVLKCSVSTIHGDVQAILKEWRSDTLRNTHTAIELERRRLDKAFTAIWKQVLDGDLNAVDRMLKISESRRKLLGLDAPAKTTVTINALDALLELLPEDLAEQVILEMASREGESE